MCGGMGCVVGWVVELEWKLSDVQKDCCPF